MQTIINHCGVKINEEYVYDDEQVNEKFNLQKICVLHIRLWHKKLGYKWERDFVASILPFFSLSTANVKSQKEFCVH